MADETPGSERGRPDRLTERIGLGVLTRLVHRDLVDEVLAETGRTERRRLDAPYPKVKVLGLGECGTHAVIDAHLAGVLVDERELARPLLASIEPDMLVLADRGFHSRTFSEEAAATDGQLLRRGPCGTVSRPRARWRRMRCRLMSVSNTLR